MRDYTKEISSMAPKKDDPNATVIQAIQELTAEVRDLKKTVRSIKWNVWVIGVVIVVGGLFARYGVVWIER